MPTKTLQRILSFALILEAMLFITTARQMSFAVESFQESDIYDTEESSEPLKSSQSALESIELPEGFQASLFAAEPMVRQPIGMTTDTKGRVWVAENYTYSEEPLGFDEKLNDRIVILEDTDHDGKADRQTVFWDQAKKLTSVEIGLGGVWALCPPNLLFIPDKDGDDHPDGEPEIVLDGWDDHGVRHNIANGLRWGPDGWLYGRHGILRTSHVGRPGTPEESRTPINCGIWRYHPLRKVFEVVAQGTTNPWGMDWDEHGQLFFINTVIGHLWHVVPGAHYERMYGEDFNPFLYGLIPQTADHFHWGRQETWSDIRKLGVTPDTKAAGGGHAHSGLLIYQGDNWPNKYRGHVFAINFHGRHLNQDILSRQGAAYTAQHGKDIVQMGDPWFRGLDLRTGADGSVFISDWSDAGECHDSDGIHRNSGRIYKIAYGSPNAPQHRDLSLLSSSQLVGLLAHRNTWYARRARHVLYDRFAAGQDMKETRKRLHELYEKTPLVTHRLQILWTLHVLEGDETVWLRRLLDDPDEHIRTWAVRLLLDQRHYSAEVGRQLTELVKREPSGLVLLFAASGLQQMPYDERWSLAVELAKRSEWADDPAFPLMLWYGIEPLVPGLSAEQVVQLVQSTKIPLLRRYVARRLATNFSGNSHSFEMLLQQIAEVNDSQLQRDLLSGIATALKGRRNIPLPKNWGAVWQKTAGSHDKVLRQLVREVAMIFGDQRAIQELLQTVENSESKLQARRDALTALISNRSPDLAPLLHRLIGEIGLSKEAVRGLAVVGNDQTAAILLTHYQSMDRETKQQTISTLASRPAFAEALLAAAEHQQIPTADFGAFVLRQMWSFEEPLIQEKISQLWPKFLPTSEEK